MRRNIGRSALFGVAACLLIAASLLVMHIGVYANPNQPVLLNQQVVPLVHQAHLVGAADANQSLNLSISLQWRDQSDLDTLLNALYNPSSPQYHHYVTPEQFDQLFAPTPDEVGQVVTYLRGNGLTVTNVSSNNLLVNATGTVAQAQQAFGTQINTYQLGTHTFYANATAPVVPSPINALIAAINGLDNSTQAQPLYHLLTTHRTSSVFLHHNTQAVTPAGYGPNDISGAYDATPLQAAGTLGDNQTIALYELDGYQSSDITQYFKQYGLGSPNVSPVLVDGVSGSAGQNAVEVEMDIELAAALAPHANQLVYEGPNTPQGMNDTYNRIVSDNRAQVVSISWGVCEPGTSPGELQTLDNIFKQGAAQGMTFFAAAGDSGAYACADTNLAVESPADDPYVTGVGGTTLQVNNGTYGSETVWSNPKDIEHGPKGGGGGGGLSTFFKQPSWQSGPGVKNQYSNGYREVPDVTANADPGTGYAIYCTVVNAGCNSGGWLVAAGTSAAAPVWAGSLALVNQYLQANGQKPVGFANPTLYKLFNAQQTFSAFNDITSGNNLYYPATSNYDLASGMGSPDVNNIAVGLLDIAQGITPTPTPTNTPTPSPTPTNTPTPTPPPAQSLIQNGDFENGQSPWQESSARGNQLIQTGNAYNGQYSANLCGYVGCTDSIWQTFTVPASYNSIIITYWWYATTDKTTKQCLDTFSAELQTTSGGFIQMLQFACNTSVSNAWVQVTADASISLANYTGQPVNLVFKGTTVSYRQLTTNFDVDAVTVMAS